jgi:hypothetical protein
MRDEKPPLPAHQIGVDTAAPPECRSHIPKWNDHSLDAPQIKASNKAQEREHTQHQSGARVPCGCGAVYEFGVDGRRVLEKDDARCQFCRTILTAWPQRLSWRVVKWPDFPGSGR